MDQDPSFLTPGATWDVFCMIPQRVSSRIKHQLFTVMICSFYHTLPSCLPLPTTPQLTMCLLGSPPTPTAHTQISVEACLRSNSLSAMPTLLLSGHTNYSSSSKTQLKYHLHQKQGTFQDALVYATFSSACHLCCFSCDTGR
jgi:hypothetical protein